MHRFLYLFFLLFIISCTEKVISQYYSLPKWEEVDIGKLKKVVVVITNNAQGTLRGHTTPIPNKILTAGRPSSIKFGGAAFLSSYIQILRSRFSENLILLDSGRFLKSHSNVEDKISFTKFYQYLKYDSILFTEEEVIHYQENNKILKQSQLPFINSNIINLKNKKILGSDIVVSSKLLIKNNLKIGIIGLTAYSARQISKHESFKGIYFEKPAVTFLEYKNKLKKNGADIIVLMANINTECTSKMPAINTITPHPKLAKITCSNQKDDLLLFLKRIPRGSLDLLVLANTKKQLRGYLLHTPIVSTPPSSGYLSLVEIFYDENDKKLIWDKSHLYPNIQLCHQFFSVTSDCSLNSNLPGFKKRLIDIKKSSLKTTIATFLGVDVKPDLKLSSFLPILR